MDESKQILPETKPTKPKAILVVYTVAAIGLVAASGLGVYYWQQYKIDNLQFQIANLNSKVSTSLATSEALKSQLSKYSTPTPLTETDTLDNGTAISYPLTPANANVIWWSQDYYSPAQANTAPDGSIELTDKRIEQFLSLIPFDTLNTMCGNDTSFSSDTAIQMYSYNPVTKAGGHNQYENCIAVVANSNSKYAAQANDVLSKAQADFTAFEGSLIVKAK